MLPTSRSSSDRGLSEPFQRSDHKLVDICRFAIKNRFAQLESLPVWG